MNKKLERQSKTMASFICSKCSKKYKTERGLEKHNKVCVAEELSEFLEEVAFEFAEEVELATTKVVKPRSVAEEITEREFLEEVAFEFAEEVELATTKVVKPRKPIMNAFLSCDCGKVCKSVRGLTQHKKVCDGQPLDTQFQCGTCGKICKSANGLNLHERRCGEAGEEHVCEKCTKVCKSKGGLTSHQKICDGTSPQEKKRKQRKSTVSAPTEDELTCNICQKIFKSRGGLTNHKKKCGADKEHHPCDACTRVLTSVRGLALHKRTCGMRDEDKIPCEFCEKRFVNESGVRLHMRRCEGNPDKIAVQKEECPTCEGSFTKTSLKTHVKKCGKEKPTEQDLTCGMCDKVYKTQRGFDNHVCKPKSPKKTPKKVTQHHEMYEDQQTPPKPSGSEEYEQQEYEQQEYEQQEYEQQEYEQQESEQQEYEQQEYEQQEYEQQEYEQQDVSSAQTLLDFSDLSDEE